MRTAPFHIGREMLVLGCQIAIRSGRPDVRGHAKVIVWVGNTSLEISMI